MEFVRVFSRPVPIVDVKNQLVTKMEANNQSVDNLKIKTVTQTMLWILLVVNLRQQLEHHQYHHTEIPTEDPRDVIRKKDP